MTELTAGELVDLDVLDGDVEEPVAPKVAAGPDALDEQ